MELELIKEKVNISSSVGKEDTSIVVENDIIVPDVKPDMLRIIISDCEITDIKTEPHNDRVVISGKMNYRILYTGDGPESTVNNITAPADFTMTAWIPGTTDNSICKLDYRVKQMDCRILNSRKLNVKAVLGVMIEVLKNKWLEFPVDINDPDQIYMENGTTEVIGYEGNAKSNENMESVIDIPSSNPDIKSIIRSDVKVLKKESKADFERIIVNGSLLANIIYIGNTDKKLYSVEQEILFERYIDMDKVYDGSMIESKAEIKNFVCNIQKDEDGEDRKIGISLELGIEAESHGKKKIDYIQDLYSVKQPVSVRYEKVMADTAHEKAVHPLSFRETVTLKNDGNVDEVCFITCMIKGISYENRDNSIGVKGTMLCNVVYMVQDSGECRGESFELPFSSQIEIPQFKQIEDIKTDAEIKHFSYSLINASQLDIRWNIDVTVSGVARTATKCVGMIQENTNDKLPSTFQSSFVIYYPRENDTLWSIAKKYMTTVDSIKQFNDMEDNTPISSMEQIFIPGK